MELREAVQEYVDGLQDQLHGRAWNITDPVSKAGFVEELTKRVAAIDAIRAKKQEGGRTQPQPFPQRWCPCGAPLTAWYQLYECDDCFEGATGERL